MIGNFQNCLGNKAPPEMSLGLPRCPGGKEPVCQCRTCKRQGFDPCSLCGEDPLEEEMATHSSILAWRIPWTEEPGGTPVGGVTKSQAHTYIHKFHSPNSKVKTEIAELGGRQVGLLSLSRRPRTQEERQALVTTGNRTSSSAHSRMLRGLATSLRPG